MKKILGIVVLGMLLSTHLNAKQLSKSPFISDKIQNEFNIPVIDPSLAALKQAEQSAILKNQFGWKPSRHWSTEAPSEDDISRFGLFKEDYLFGNRIIVK